MTIKTINNKINIFKSSLLFSFGTIISRLTGIIRDMLFAFYIGSSSSSDSLFAAIKIPNFFRNIFVEGALSNSFIPQHSQIFNEEGKKSAIEFSQQVFGVILIFMIIFYIISYPNINVISKIFVPGLFNRPDATLDILPLIKITWWYILLISIINFFSNLLNIKKQFFITGFIPCFYNLGMIFMIILTSNNILNFSSNNPYNVSICLGVVIAGIIQTIILIIFLIKSNSMILPSIPKNHGVIKKFLYRVSIFSGNAIIIQLSGIVDMIMISDMNMAITYVYYAERLVQLPIALIGTSIATVTLPALSQAQKLQSRLNNCVSQTNKTECNNSQNSNLHSVNSTNHQDNSYQDNSYQDNELQYNNLIRDAFNSIFLLALPATCGLFILSDSIISLLFFRGEFSLETKDYVNLTVKILCLTIPIIAINKLFNNIILSHNSIKSPIIFSSISLAIKIPLNLILISHFGYNGVIISSVICGFIVLFLYLMKIRTYTINLAKILFSSNLVKSIISCIIMSITLILIKNYYPIQAINSYSLIDIIKLTITICFGIIIYFSVYFFLFQIKTRRLF